MFIFSLALLLSCIANARTSSLRSVGGREALPNEFPYVVCIESITLIKNKEEYMIKCSGSALTSSWTLTAAHCNPQGNNTSYEKFVIRYGLKEKPLRTDIIKSVVYHGYFGSPYFLKNDIGLIKHHSIKLEQYAKLSAVDYSALIGTEAISAGYGISFNESDTKMRLEKLTNRPLQVVPVMIAKCDSSYIQPAICLSPKCGVRAYSCSGDSGGPVIHPSGVIAVHSFGFKSERAKTFPELKYAHKYTSVDTPISPFNSWIVNEVTKD